MKKKNNRKKSLSTALVLRAALLYKVMGGDPIDLQCGFFVSCDLFLKPMMI
jgi:hypothetical protein